MNDPEMRRGALPLKVLVASFAFNEGLKIQATVRRFREFVPVSPDPYDYLVVDDGSDDGTAEWLAQFPDVKVLRNERNMGIGFGMKKALRTAVDLGYDVVIITAGNDKDRPEDIPTLLKAVREGQDFVQGSRYLAGGGFGNMPFSRHLLTRYVHPIIFFLFSGRWMKDTTNGFRAIRTSFLKDPHVQFEQEWLDRYELEPYLFLKAIKLGYKVAEVPVTKIYPTKK